MLKGLKSRRADIYAPRGYSSVFRKPVMSPYGGGDDFYYRYVQGI